MKDTLPVWDTFEGNTMTYPGSPAFAHYLPASTNPPPPSPDRETQES